MSRKVSLAGALGDLSLGTPTPTPAAAPNPDVETDANKGTQTSRTLADNAAPAAPQTKKRATPRQASPAPLRSAPPAPVAEARDAAPRYLQLTRKETRLREDQAEELTLLARRLSRLKSPGGERITDNTLIRVAVDLLLERSDQLAGTTEDELRNSVTS